MKKTDKTTFQNMVIQSKDDKEDFRAFVHCTDENGDMWELRGYGKTAAEAAEYAWDAYVDGSYYWDVYGNIIKSPSVVVGENKQKKQCYCQGPDECSDQDEYQDELNDDDKQLNRLLLSAKLLIIVSAVAFIVAMYYWGNV